MVPMPAIGEGPLLAGLANGDARLPGLLAVLLDVLLSEKLSVLMADGDTRFGGIGVPSDQTEKGRTNRP